MKFMWNAYIKVFLFADNIYSSNFYARAKRHDLVLLVGIALSRVPLQSGSRNYDSIYFGIRAYVPTLSNSYLKSILGYVGT
jgi:hypothetical protein